MSAREEALGELLSAALKLARKRAGLTQFEVALRMDVARTVVSKLECGARMPSLSMLSSFGKAVDLPAWKLLRHAERGAEAHAR